MRITTLPLVLAASLGLTTPVMAQNDLGNILGGLAQGLIQQDRDRSAYIVAQQTNTVAAYRTYLANYPRGQFRTNAEQALARLGAPVTPSADTASQAEMRLGVTLSQRRAVQRELTRLGYSTYGADGNWGRNTRTAIATWQRDKGDRVTGYLTEVQLRVLLRGGVVVTPPDNGTPQGNLSAAQVEARLSLTRSQRTDIQRQLTSLGYDAGVADGLWGSRTRSAIGSWQRANRKAQTGYVTAGDVRLIASQAGNVAPVPDTTNAAAEEESLLGLTVAERASVQRSLIRLGYGTVRTDGTFGAGTRRAIAAWQGDEGEPVTGYLTADQVRLIRVETGG